MFQAKAIFLHRCNYFCVIVKALNVNKSCVWKKRTLRFRNSIPVDPYCKSWVRIHAVLFLSCMAFAVMFWLYFHFYGVDWREIKLFHTAMNSSTFSKVSGRPVLQQQVGDQPVHVGHDHAPQELGPGRQRLLRRARPWRHGYISSSITHWNISIHT
jgi:hypothetical protein